MAAFSKRHYEAVARALLMARPDQVMTPRSPLIVGAEFTGWARGVHEIARVFQADNAAFDQDRFLKAAGHSA